MTFRERFRALFSPHRRWLDAESTLIQAGGILGPRQRVALRSECLHRRLSFPGVPASQRERALALAVQRESPVPGGRHAARWQGDVAQVWVLPPDAQPGLGVDEVLVSESSLLPPPPGGEGARLVALRVGVEGQVWRDGDLASSRWWPEVPDAASWQRFLRASGVADAVSPPLLESLPLLGEPWGRSGSGVAWAPAQLESAFWSVLVAVAGLVLGWQLAATVTWTVAGAWQAHRLEGLRASAAPLIAARERAEAARARIDAYVALTETPVDLVLQAELRALLPDDARFAAWARDASQLRVDVVGAGDDPRVFVQALAEHPRFRVVVANPVGEGRMQLDIPLVPETSDAEEAP